MTLQRHFQHKRRPSCHLCCVQHACLHIEHVHAHQSQSVSKYRHGWRKCFGMPVDVTCVGHAGCVKQFKQQVRMCCLDIQPKQCTANQTETQTNNQTRLAAKHLKCTYNCVDKHCAQSFMHMQQLRANCRTSGCRPLGTTGFTAYGL